MTSIDVLENKISDIKKYLKILEQYQAMLQAKIEEDVTIKGAVERYLYLAVQSAIDLAEAVIAFKGFRKPSIYSENFKILGEEKIISSDLAQHLAMLALTLYL